MVPDFNFLLFIVLLIPYHCSLSDPGGTFDNENSSSDNKIKTWSETFSWNSFTNGVSNFACKFTTECCRPPFLRRTEAATILRKRLENDFFGQHIAYDRVITALDAHLQDPKPGKALVFSFHGWAGSGKTFLAQLIIESLFKRGMESSYMKFYLGSLHFPDESKVKEYQEDLRIEIRRTLSRCKYSVFVFDEVDITPPGVFNAIVPFIEYPGSIDAIDHKKAIFIFLSNTGSNQITTITLDGWKAGKRRKELTFHDYEEELKKEAFNKEENGLYRTRLIDRVLIDYFIPFLPMERKHIMQCIQAEAQRHNAEGMFDYEEIAESLTYWPADLKLYSISGCKKIEAAVKYRITRDKYERKQKKKTDVKDEL